MMKIKIDIFIQSTAFIEYLTQESVQALLGLWTRSGRSEVGVDSSSHSIETINTTAKYLYEVRLSGMNLFLLMQVQS